jgi:hypothetical protein
MNNLNYIGSSVFIINMDFNYKYMKKSEELKLNEMIKITNGKGFQIKKPNENRELILPPIK